MHEELGPLRGLLGIWEGDKGDDTAPSDDRGTETNKFSERMVFEKLTPVVNHEQVLQGLRYRTTAIRLGEKDPFHEELGYWLWDGTHKQVLRCFMVPRGVTVIAGGTAEAEAKNFELKADVGSHTYGICSNQFLDKEFKTVHYVLKLSWDAKKLQYEEDTQIQIKGKPGFFTTSIRMCCIRWSSFRHSSTRNRSGRPTFQRKRVELVVRFGIQNRHLHVCG